MDCDQIYQVDKSIYIQSNSDGNLALFENSVDTHPSKHSVFRNVFENPSNKNGIQQEVKRHSRKSSILRHSIYIVLSNCVYQLPIQSIYVVFSKRVGVFHNICYCLFQQFTRIFSNKWFIQNEWIHSICFT